MLEVRDLHAFYGKSHILQGVDLTIREGEIVSLLGRNGVGRSTTCKAIMGLVAPQGEVRFKGQAIAGMRPDQIAHLGIGYVPEDRQVFPGLTVQQNLELGLKRAGVFGRWGGAAASATRVMARSRSCTASAKLSSSRSRSCAWAEG